MNEINPKAVIGTNAWGDALYGKVLRGSVVDKNTLKAAMKMANEINLRVVDSARDYGLGKGPKLIGECCPKEMMISSKFTPFKKYKKGSIRDSVIQDLSDFGREMIDIYWLHMPNDIKENLTDIIELKKEGIIKNIGVSNFNIDECKIAKNVLEEAGIPLYAVQNHYSIIEREWEKNGLVDWCHENSIGFWAWAVLEEGILIGPKKKSEKNTLMKFYYNKRRKKLDPLFNVMGEIGNRYNLTIAQVAIAFVANKGIVPICGCRKPYQVKELREAVDVQLKDDEMKTLQNIADESNVKILGPDMFRFAVKK